MADRPLDPSAALTERYRVEKELGRGGMATVYLARDVRHDRDVALKVLHPELGAVLGAERFLAEIKITARLDHPHILTLIDSGEADGLLYYVLPFVRGESLRDLLRREKQLSLDQALTIARHVGAALDYAHKHGVVHRDIKPENILLQEGEAMLADFGIALAVKEAGGNRLTETGLSLGTPQYMSPEQATGDRQLDARSDVYSLGAVFYEMLVGEPPMTGSTVQAVIAKLLTEPPTRIRVVRGTVPEGVDAAVAKALSKIPSDRFASAGDFIRALDAGLAAPAAPRAGPPARSRFGVGALVTTVVVLLAAVGVLAWRARSAPRGAVALRDRTQLTFTGGTSGPAISADGKQLAFFVRGCSNGRCTYAVELQDVGSTTTRRVLDGLTATYGLEWSPDRRNLIVTATIDGQYGAFLLPVLGGTPRFLSAGAVTFFAGGDSLLIGPASGKAPFVVRVVGVNGAGGDSVLVPGPGQALTGLSSIPGTSRFVALVIQSGQGLWQIVDRRGQVVDQLLNSCTCGGMAARDAIWMTRAGPTVAEAVVRVALDPGSGRLADRQDTVYTGRFTGMTVTADGGQMVIDDGSYTSTVVGGRLADLLQGRLPAEPLMQGSLPQSAGVSPDGRRLLIRRTLPAQNGENETRLAVATFGGGAETPLAASGQVRSAGWEDSVTVGVATRTPKGTHLELIDIRTGAVRAAHDLDDPRAQGVTAIPGGWAWIPATGDKVVIETAAGRVEVAKPAWYSRLFDVTVSPDGGRLALVGWNASTQDSLGVSVVAATGGTPEAWIARFAESGYATWLNDGSLLFPIWETAESVTLLQLTGPDRVKVLGTVPHSARLLSVDRDLGNATLGWRDYHGDAWLYRVDRP